LNCWPPAAVVSITCVCSPAATEQWPTYVHILEAGRGVTFKLKSGGRGGGEGESPPSPRAGWWRRLVLGIR
jgi:hypothetical protein